MPFEISEALPMTACLAAWIEERLFDDFDPVFRYHKIGETFQKRAVSSTVQWLRQRALWCRDTCLAELAIMMSDFRNIMRRQCSLEKTIILREKKTTNKQKSAGKEKERT